MCRNRSSDPGGPDPTIVRSAFRIAHADTVPACRTPGRGIRRIPGVVARQDGSGGARLVGYVVAAAGASVDGAALRGALGEEKVVEVDPVMGGEDFSRYGLDTGVPISMLWLGAVDPERWQRAQDGGPALPSLHSSEFAPLPEPTIRTGVTALVTGVLELMGRPEPAR